MARIRTIKPEFFTSEDIVDLTPLARIFFIALWCEADREGRLKWKPRTLKMRYLPADDCDVDILAQELIDGGLVVVYADGKYAEIPGFTKHQVINNRESSSVIPARVTDASRTRGHASNGTSPDCEEGVKNDASRTRHARVTDAPSFPFPSFWSVYPRKEGKKRAETLWAKLSDADREAAIEDCQKRFSGQAREFIPHGDTYLSGRRWEDEMPPQSKRDIHPEMRGVMI